MKKRVELALVVALSAAPAAWAAASGVSAGNAMLRMEPGQAATRTSGFTGNFYEAGGTGGQVLSNVNTFTGQPSYTVPLHTLSPRGEVAFPFNLTFSGPTFPTVENGNARAPAGWIGAGWSMATPFVAINHKGTRNYGDDVIMCNLGPYGGGQILWQPKSERYYLATAPGIVITRDTVSNSSSPLYRQVKAWTFTIPGSGVRLVFGDASSDTVVGSQRYLQHARGMILASPYNSDSSKPFVYRWDLRRMESASGRTGIDFEYERFQEPLWNGKTYTREAHLKNAVWRDEFGNEIERVELELDTLEPGEYSGYFPGEAKTSQRLVEKHRLRALAVFHEGRPYVRRILKRSVKNLPYGKKGVLDSITPYFGPGQKRGPGWAFRYRNADQLLDTIFTPSGGKEQYEYQTLNLDATAGGRSGKVPFRDTTGSVLIATNNASGWRPETSCDDRFCYEIVRKTSGTQRVYVRAAYNTGNYFDTTAIVFQKILQADTTSADQWQIVPMGDYLLVSNNEWATVDLWEWDGSTFQRRNDSVGEPDDPIRTHFGFASGKFTDISVIPGGANYFLVYRNEERGSLPRRLWVYLKDPLTGKWSNLTRGTRGTSDCKFNNYPKLRNGGALYDPAEGDSCFTWKSGLLFAANERMFAVRILLTPNGETSQSFLYWYALNAQGTGFDSIGQLTPYFPDSIQGISGGTLSPQNWKYRINDMKTGPDYLAIKAATSTGTNDSRYDLVFYDGTRVKRIGALGWEDDNSSRGPNLAVGSNDDRYVLHGPNYFLHVNTRSDGPKRVEYWRKRQNADSVYFEKTSTFRTDIPHEGDGDARFGLGTRNFSVEYYPGEAFDISAYPQAFPKTDGSGNIQSWLYRINDTAGVDSVPAAYYTFQWDVCARKVWNMSFSDLDNVLMGAVHRGGSGCGCTSGCRVRNLSAKLNPLSAALALDTITDPIQSVGGLVLMRDRSWSFAARLGLAMFITSVSGTPDTVWSQRYFYDGHTYSSSVTTDIVRRFVRQTTPDSAHPSQVTEFEFLPGDTSFVTAFNHNQLTAQFEYAKITHSGLPGGQVYTQYVDHMGYKLLLDSAGLSGRVRCITTLNGNDDTIAVQHTAFAAPYSRGWFSSGLPDTSVHDPWPQGVAMNRVEKTVARQWANNRSRQTHRSRYHVFSDTLESPLFTVTEQGNRRAVTQSILTPDGSRVRRSLAYDYPDTATLTEAFLKGYRNAPLPTSGTQGKYAVNSSEVVYDSVFKYQVRQTYGWRDSGGSWDDEELKTGPVPDFDPDANLFVASEATKRDSLGQPLETLVEDGDARNYASVFYEGRAALPVGVVTGARRDNAAVLTAENAPVPQLLAQGKLDRDKAWDAPGVTYDSAKVHTGRYSFKVTDNFGPSGNLYLKDVSAGGFGFVASAWIYGAMDSAPIFSMARRHSNGSVQNEVRGAPVGGAYQRGKWQRWEARISHDSLVAGGMFADGNGDYLRFFIGSGSPSSDPSKVIYVDDVVLRPDNSVFSTTAYNERGQPTRLTDTHHRMTMREYDLTGQPTGTRDDRGRIFSQGGYNKPGENLP